MLKLASLFFIVAKAQDADTSSLNEVVDNLDITPDAEELQMAKNMMSKEDASATQSAGWKQPPGVDEKETHEREEMESEQEKTKSEEAQTKSEAGTMEVATEDAPLELATEDAPPPSTPHDSAAGGDAPHELLVVPARPPPANAPKKGKSKVAKATAAPNAGDTSAISMVSARLASEEQFNLRIQKLLAQSTLDDRKNQQKVAELTARLKDATQQQKQMRGNSMKQASEDENESAKQRARADKAEKQLKKAQHDAGVGQKAVTWLRNRVNTLLGHLSTVTHIGKEMEERLVAVSAKAESNGKKLVQMQHEAQDPKAFGSKLHEAQSAEEKAEDQMHTMEKHMQAMQQRMQSMQKVDLLLHAENTILKSRLAKETSHAGQLSKDLDTTKGAMADMQNSKIQLQSQYADSLKAMIIAQASGGTQSAAAPDAGVAPPVASAPAAQPAGPQASGASLGQELNQDSRSLTALIQESRRSKTVRKPVKIAKRKLTLHQSDELQLNSNSQGLSALLKGLSHSAAR